MLDEGDPVAGTSPTTTTRATTAHARTAVSVSARIAVTSSSNSSGGTDEANRLFALGRARIGTSTVQLIRAIRSTQ